MVGFIGRNGAGKSSTINVLMGFRRPAAGAARLFGVASQEPRARRSVGYLPEAALYYPWLSALETLQLYGELQDLPAPLVRSRSLALLEELGLAGREHEQLRSFSKGMLQRVGIAQALLGEPRLLVLDEVFSGLDPVGRRQVRELLLRRRNAGVTIFFSSHELAEVSLLCDRVAVIHHGELVADEPLVDLSWRLCRYRLTAQAPDSARQGTAPPVPGRLYRGHYQGEFESEEAREEAAACLRARGFRNLELTRLEGSLEDYFTRLVGGGTD